MARRLIVSSSAAALALVLVAPTAALADPGNGKSDPAGNNGTIKIDYPAPADSGHANRPHPGCAFQLRMFDFDKNQYGSITFVGQAPTKLGTLLTQPHMLLSDDAAGGGQDVDAVYSYTAQQLGLIGQPQAKQGWHVKVSVDAENAPGGAKHKVFWLHCPAAEKPAGTSTSTSTSSGSGAATSTSTPTSASTATSPKGAESTTEKSTTPVTGGATSGAATLGANSVGSGQAFTGGSGSTTQSATRPAAKRTAPVSRGSALPFTGFALGTLVLIALATLVAGGLAIRAGRRRTADDL